MLLQSLYFSRLLLNRPRPLSSFDTHARWQRVMQSASSRWSYEKIGDCEESSVHVKTWEWPRVGKCPAPGQHKICKCPTPGTDKAAKCPVVDREGGGGGWAQLELTDALLKAVSILRVCLTLWENMRRPPLFALDQCDFPEIVHQARLWP